jgi:hypothetical protein
MIFRACDGTPRRKRLNGFKDLENVPTGDKLCSDTTNFTEREESRGSVACASNTGIRA